MTKKILARTRVIAVVGASRESDKPSHHVPAEMRRHGWRIVPVNPWAEEILGEVCYPSLAAIPHPVDLVVVFRPSRRAVEVVREAVEVGVPAVWLQSGIASPEARQIAERAGIDYVEDRCVAVERARHGLTPPPEN